MALSTIARSAARNILTGSLRVDAVRNGRPHVALVVDKSPCELGSVLADGYRNALAGLRTCDNEPVVCHNITFEPATFVNEIEELQRTLASYTGCSDELLGCILVQRGAFQNELRSYRLRLRLFEMGLRVAEHAHLAPMSTEEREMHAYLKSCAYPADEAQAEGKRLALALDTFATPRTPMTILSRATPEGDDSLLELRVDGYLEACLLNTGCYEAAHDPVRNCIRAIREARGANGVMASNIEERNKRSAASKSGASIGVSIGGTFPTGEVITEAEDLGALHGKVSIFAYPNTSKRMQMMPQSFEISIEKGVVVSVSHDAPASFQDLVGLIREVEGEVVVREIGIGLNPHLGRGQDQFLTDVTSFERQRGVHLSLGKRHPLFVKKASLPTPERPHRPASYIRAPVRRKDGTFHVDVFVDAVALTIPGVADDGTSLFDYRF
jgi:aminopeptidase